MTIVPNLRSNVFVPFPQTIGNTGPVTITKANGIWSVGFNIAQLAGLPSNYDPSTKLTIVYDQVTQSFLNISLAGLGLPAGAITTQPVTVNFNAGNADTQIPINLPLGFTRYQVTAVVISGASQTLTTATAGLFTGAGGTGVAIVTAASAITVNTAADNTNNNSQAMTINNAGTEDYTAASLFFRVATPQGAPATGKVVVHIRPVS